MGYARSPAHAPARRAVRAELLAYASPLGSEYDFGELLFWTFSGVVHAALGQVARDPALLPSRRPNWAAGPGARIMLNEDERLNLRADLGLGPGTWGVYVGIGEAS